MIVTLNTSPSRGSRLMTAYRLQARHSITLDRARGNRRSDAVIQIRCALTVHQLALQSLINGLLQRPLSRRHPRAISITNISSHDVPLSAGARTWTFTIVLRTSNKLVRTHTWWGRQLPKKELEELPLALLQRFEEALNHAWFAKSLRRAVPRKGVGVLLMSD